MSEALSPAISLADVYNSILASAPAVGTRRVSRTSDKTDAREVERQCLEIDELWNELSSCIHHWRNYPVEFIATRFANMHYVAAPQVGNADPPEEVWAYLVKKINDQVYGKLVVMRIPTFTKGRVYAWK